MDLTYMRSRGGDALIDRAIAHVFRHYNSAAKIRDFAPTGYDQRQHRSAGFDLPVDGFTRTPNGEHAQSWWLIRALDISWKNRGFQNLSFGGLPTRSRRRRLEQSWSVAKDERA